MKVIAVTNRKGGVGKSTMASHIAAGLASRGRRVALVDTDSQGNAGLMLRMPQEDGLFNLLISKLPLDEIVHQVPVENYTNPETATHGSLYLVPSSERTYQIPHMLKPDESFLFLEKLEEIVDATGVEVVIVDTNPSMSLFDGSVYLAADAFIYVTECEMLSMQGVRQAFEQMQRFGAQRARYLNRDSRIMGIIPNKFRVNTIIHQENVRQLRDYFGEIVWDEVVLRTVWTEASNFFQPVFRYAPDSKAAEQAWQMVDRVEKELKQWQTDENA